MIPVADQRSSIWPVSRMNNPHETWPIPPYLPITSHVPASVLPPHMVGVRSARTSMSPVMSSAAASGVVARPASPGGMTSATFTPPCVSLTGVLRPSCPK